MENKDFDFTQSVYNKIKNIMGMYFISERKYRRPAGIFAAG
jgi:hypothetical protein